MLQFKAEIASVWDGEASTASSQHAEHTDENSPLFDYLITNTRLSAFIQNPKGCKHNQCAARNLT